MKSAMSVRIAVSAFAWVLMCAQSAFPHARLLPTGTLPPRDTIAHKVANSIPGTATDPGCVVARNATQAVTNLTAGSVQNIQWEEFIDHTSVYEIWFSPNANDSAMVKIPFIGGTPATAQDIAGQINNPAQNHQYSATITVPATACTQCAIRLVQVMMDGGAPTYYYSCANVQITDAGAGGGGASASPSPTAVPATTAPTGELEKVDCPDHPAK